jgi:K+ transporter
MQINKLHDDVYEINNFLTYEEIQEVYKIINTIPEKDWYPEGQDASDFWYGKNLQFNTNNVFDLINDKMKNLLESFDYYPSKNFFTKI